MSLFFGLIGALAYAAKGGWHEKIHGWQWMRSKMPWFMQELPYHRIFPLILIFFAAVFIAPFWQSVFFTAAFAFCFSSMGEEAGAVGSYKGGWGDYIDKGFGRSYGIKKALQWGLAWGGLLTLVTGCVWFVPAGATFPVCYFIGSSIAAYRGQQGWAYAEPIYGAVMGIAMGVWLDGF